MFIKWLLYFVGCMCVNYAVIRVLLRYQVGQHIYELSPERHQQKANTPSLGGISIILGLFAGAAAFLPLSGRVTWVLATIAVFSLIGFLDDFLALRSKSNKGMSAKLKFSIQFATAVGLLLVFHSVIQPISPLYFGFLIMVIVGSSNATNLTDGLDGLLASLSIVTLVGFWIIAMWLGYPGIALLSAIWMISIAAFAIFNWHPAQVFMGDTGSLALGAGFAAIAIALGNPWFLVGLGTMYIFETMSVILQVFFFKTTGERLFKMSPLHHHFELSGVSERKIVVGFFLAGTGFSLLFLAGWMLT